MAFDATETEFHMLNTSNSYQSLYDGTETNLLRDIEILQMGDGDDMLKIDGSYNDYTVYGGLGADTITLGNEAIDAVDLYGNVDLELRGGSNWDTLVGGSSNELIVGGSGNDVLIGGAGNDTIDGGWEGTTTDGSSDIDSMVCGAGADVFVFNMSINSDVATTTRSEFNALYDRGTKIISDFAVGTDVLLFNDVNTTLGSGYLANLDAMTITDDGSDVTIDLNSGQLSIVLEGVGDGTIDTAAELLTNILSFDNAYSSSTTSFIEDLDVVSLYGGDSGSRLDATGFDSVVSDDNDYKITINDSVNEVVIGSGQDTIYGDTDYSSTIDGGAGNDVIVGRTAHDYLVGGCRCR